LELSALPVTVVTIEQMKWLMSINLAKLEAVRKKKDK
jgi:hypothetical protein